MNFYACALPFDHIHIARFIRGIRGGDKNLVGARGKKNQRWWMTEIRSVDRQRSVGAIPAHYQRPVSVLEIEADCGRHGACMAPEVQNLS
jgi:hypothetical protein